MKLDQVFALDNAGWPVLLVDATGMICRANKMAVKVFGPELENLPIALTKLWAPDNPVPAEQFAKHWDRSPAPTFTLKFRVRNGIVPYLTSVSAFAQDTQRFLVLQLLPQHNEAALAQKQKLDCALQLARTVSLDFNNALTTILSNTSFLLGRAQSTHPWRESLIQMEKAAAQAAEISDDLGTFSRQEKETRTPTASSLNSILERAVDSLRQGPVGHLVHWSVELERQLFSAKFDEAKIQQALQKILENAVESLQINGRVQVASRNFETSEPYQDGSARLQPGTFVCIEITDNGSGIDPEVQPRVFEPFFTTKTTGNHRGLGLALVYGIVTNHGGAVAISSTPGTGTNVRVYLPAEKKVVSEKVFAPGELDGHETVLVVDDDQLLLSTCRLILSSHGYTVATAPSGEKALELLNGKEHRFDLMITDLVMPTMSGRELMERVRSIQPAVRIICSTGSVWPTGGDEELRLQKPYTSQALLRKVKQALAHR